MRFGCREPEEMRLFLLGKDLPLNLDNKTLEELHVENEAAFLATRRPQSNVPVRLSNELMVCSHRQAVFVYMRMCCTRCIYTNNRCHTRLEIETRTYGLALETRVF